MKHQMKEDSQKFFMPGGSNGRSEPRLIGSEGYYGGIRVRVVSQDLKHKGWGNYTGYLTVIDMANQKHEIPFSLYSPDYEYGEWYRRNWVPKEKHPCYTNAKSFPLWR